MIELKKCCEVPFPEKLFEQFEIKENVIYANVNASKVLGIMKYFIKMHREPLFFILEIPRKKQDIPDGTARNPNNDNDVYFIDGLDSRNACRCLDMLGDFLIKDGLNTFGIGCHESHEEILFGNYNIMTVYAQNPKKYIRLMKRFHIEQTDALITVWDTFDQEHPGKSRRYDSEETGKNIYDIPEAFKKYGMYLYKPDDITA
ncbi:MAG: hypothetical protein E7603_05760 [Ruminococcaceae bacterium]|nr:hypothetical protein [Oscillospiraceae bacterium]